MTVTIAMAFDNKNLKKLQDDITQWARDLDMQTILRLKRNNPSMFRDLCQSHVLRKFWSHVVIHVKNADLLEKVDTYTRLENLKHENENQVGILDSKLKELLQEEEEIKRLENKIAAKKALLHEAELNTMSTQHECSTSDHKVALQSAYSEKVKNKQNDLNAACSKLPKLSNHVSNDSFKSFHDISKHMQEHLATLACETNNVLPKSYEDIWEYISSEHLNLSQDAVPSIFQNLCKQEIDLLNNDIANNVDDLVCSNDMTQGLLLKNSEICLKNLAKVAHLELKSREGTDLIKGQLFPQCAQMVDENPLINEEKMVTIKNQMDFLAYKAALEFATSKVDHLTQDLNAQSKSESCYKHLVSEIRSYDKSSYVNQQKMTRLISSNNMLLNKNFLINEFNKIKDIKLNKTEQCKDMAAGLHENFKTYLDLEQSKYNNFNLMFSRKFLCHGEEISYADFTVNGCLSYKPEYQALSRIFNLSGLCHTSDILKFIDSIKSTYMCSKSLVTIPLFELCCNTSKRLSSLLQSDTSFYNDITAPVTSFNECVAQFEFTYNEWVNQPAKAIIQTKDI